MDPYDDPRYVNLFREVWSPSLELVTAISGPEHAERITVDVFARVLERWHRASRRDDPGGRVLARTAAAAVEHAKRQGTSVPLRAAEVREAWEPPAAAPSPTVVVDPVLRAGLTGMPRKVAIAFVLRHLTGRDDDEVASATGTSRRKAAARADRGLEILRRHVGPGGHELLDG